jgi:hypothetical protein
MSPFGMETRDGNEAVSILVDRLRDLHLDDLVCALRDGVGLIASFHPEVRSLRVGEAIAAALLD